jgi:hypothetical protein
MNTNPETKVLPNSTDLVVRIPLKISREIVMVAQHFKVRPYDLVRNLLNKGRESTEYKGLLGEAQNAEPIENKHPLLKKPE